MHRLIVLLLSLAAWHMTFAKPLGLETALRRPTFLSMQLSPDGQRLTAVATSGSGVGVVIIDARTLEARLLTDSSSKMVLGLTAHWLTNDTIAVDTLFGVEVYSASGAQVSTSSGRYVRAVRPDRSGHERMLVRQGKSRYALIDARTGAETPIVFDRPGEPVRWVFDSDGVPRVVTVMNTAFWSDDTKVTHWYRDSGDSPWRELASFSVLEDRWDPQYIMRDGRSLAVTSTQGRDTRAYFRYDLARNVVAEMLAGHSTQDVYAHRSESDESYDVVLTEGMKPEFHWYDAKSARLQAAIDKAVPDRINRIDAIAGNRVLVFSYADVDPGRWFLLDSDKSTLREIAAVRPDIDPAAMRPMRIVSYPARDGLTIAAYLTVPDGADGPAPTIVLIHGGPMARDTWQWDVELQMLASRGYVVFQPQFRGSSGFGKRFLEAGFGQWGLAMQDDITDGVEWLVHERIADPARICVYGASYGGYASLWALVKTPELFRCGIDLSGLSDLDFSFKDDSDVNDEAFARLWRRRIVGDPKTAKERLDAVSPLQHAAGIKAPVLIAHGDRDIRVPISHSERMVEALKREHKDVQWLQLQGEGHAITGALNVARYYDALFKFLDEHIGSGAPAAGVAPAASATASP